MKQYSGMLTSDACCRDRRNPGRLFRLIVRLGWLCVAAAEMASAQSSRSGWGSTPYHDATGTGVTFRVWAPNATSVYVPGQFNGWSQTATPLGQDLTVASNDNWGGSALIAGVASSVGAFALTDAAGKDAVILVTLDPGVYSAKVTGVNNTSGITLAEVYEVP